MKRSQTEVMIDFLKSIREHPNYVFTRHTASVNVLPAFARTFMDSFLKHGFIKKNARTKQKTVFQDKTEYFLTDKALKFLDLCASVQNELKPVWDDFVPTYEQKIDCLNKYNEKRKGVEA